MYVSMWKAALFLRYSSIVIFFFFSYDYGLSNIHLPVIPSTVYLFYLHISSSWFYQLVYCNQVSFLFILQVLAVTFHFICIHTPLIQVLVPTILVLVVCSFLVFSRPFFVENQSDSSYSFFGRIIVVIIFFILYLCRKWKVTLFSLASILYFQRFQFCNSPVVHKVTCIIVHKSVSVISLGIMPFPMLCVHEVHCFFFPSQYIIFTSINCISYLFHHSNIFSKSFCSSCSPYG